MDNFLQIWGIWYWFIVEQYWRFILSWSAELRRRLLVLIGQRSVARKSERCDWSKNLNFIIWHLFVWRFEKLLENLIKMGKFRNTIAGVFVWFHITTYFHHHWIGNQFIRVRNWLLGIRIFRCSWIFCKKLQKWLQCNF